MVTMLLCSMTVTAIKDELLLLMVLLLNYLDII